MLLLIGVAATASAQIEKGRYTVGGSADLSMTYNDRNTTFNLAFSPQFGVFVVRGFVVGGRYSFAVGSSSVFSQAKQTYTVTTTFTTNIGPVLKYYYGKKPLKGVASANGGYSVQTVLRSKDITNINGFTVGGSLGMAYFFNPHISLETAFYVNASGYETKLPTSRMGFSVGLFAFLDKKKPE